MYNITSYTIHYKHDQNTGSVCINVTLRWVLTTMVAVER
jgi:hypothetical protein